MVGWFGWLVVLVGWWCIGCGGGGWGVEGGEVMWVREWW